MIQNESTSAKNDKKCLAVFIDHRLTINHWHDAALKEANAILRCTGRSVFIEVQSY